MDNNFSLYSDMYKDAYGFRPTYERCREWTDADYDQEFKRLDDAVAQRIAKDREDQERAAHDVEIVFSNLLMCGARDREMALRWLHEAHYTGGDNDFLCFKLGLRYGYFDDKG